MTLSINRIKQASSLVFLCLTLAITPNVNADESFWSWLISPYRKKEVAPVTDVQYQKECSACHFPYQPGWLPARSWQKLLTAESLKDHFGDNAELDEGTREHILAFVIEHAADKSYYKRSRKIMSTLDDNDIPIRISKIPYIAEKHSGIDPDRIKNKSVGSLSHCNRCHRKAQDSDFDDDTVLIPTQ